MREKKPKQKNAASDEENKEDVEVAKIDDGSEEDIQVQSVK